MECTSRQLLPPSSVALRPSALAELRAATARAAPAEMVRLLAGHPDGTAVQIVGTWELPGAVCARDHFQVDAAVFARAEAAIRAAGLQWLGFAHSHPHGPAHLSAVDRAALWPDCVQLLVAGDGRDEGTIRAFWLHGGTAQALPVGATGGRA